MTFRISKDPRLSERAGMVTQKERMKEQKIDRGKVRKGGVVGSSGPLFFPATQLA